MEFPLKIPDFHDLYVAIGKRTEKYGLKVETCDVVDPNTGDFDGTRILIDYVVGDELALFVLVHLFGHTVQWNTSEELRQLGMNAVNAKTEADLQKVFEYERDGTRYGIQLMHESNINDMDQWASDWFHADWQFLKHFYLTGEKIDSKELFKAGAGELLTPLEIPTFKPQKFVSRYAF